MQKLIKKFKGLLDLKTLSKTREKNTFGRLKIKSLNIYIDKKYI